MAVALRVVSHGLSYLLLLLSLPSCGGEEDEGTVCAADADCEFDEVRGGEVGKDYLCLRGGGCTLRDDACPHGWRFPDVPSSAYYVEPGGCVPADRLIRGGAEDALAWCDGGWVKVHEDPTNCGACGQTCGADTVCRGSECVPCGKTSPCWCGDDWHTLGRDEECASCNTPCAADELCKSKVGHWVCEACPAGSVICDGECQDATNWIFGYPATPCGACSTPCQRGQVCIDGRCSPCEELGAEREICGIDDQGWKCADLENSKFDCGACGRDCRQGSSPNYVWGECVRGECVY